MKPSITDSITIKEFTENIKYIGPDFYILPTNASRLTEHLDSIHQWHKSDTFRVQDRSLWRYIYIPDRLPSEEQKLALSLSIPQQTIIVIRHDS